jgi:hypothetical protein
MMMMVSAYMNHMTIKILKQDLDYLSKENDKLEKSLHQRINVEVEGIQNNLKSNYKHTDSRVDNLELKVYRDFDLVSNQRRGY